MQGCVTVVKEWCSSRRPQLNADETARLVWPKSRSEDDISKGKSAQQHRSCMQGILWSHWSEEPSVGDTYPLRSDATTCTTTGNFKIKLVKEMKLVVRGGIQFWKVISTRFSAFTLFSFVVCVRWPNFKVNTFLVTRNNIFWKNRPQHRQSIGANVYCYVHSLIFDLILIRNRLPLFTLCTILEVKF